MALNMSFRQQVINYSYLVLGAFTLSFGIVGFLSPNKIVTGGTAGMAIVLHHVFSLPTGVLLALINVPLLLISIRFLGKYFAVKTVLAVVLISFFTDLLSYGFQLKPLCDHTLLATLYGGGVVGVALGLIFKAGGSAGGGTILAKMITEKYPVKTGTVVLIVDVLVVLLAGIVFRSVELALWGMISIYIASRLIDLVLTGKSTAKIVHVSSSTNLSALAQMLHHELQLSGTFIRGTDLLQGEKKDVLLVVVENNRLYHLKSLISFFDQTAKVVVMEAAELHGTSPVINKKALVTH
ncbi:MAG: YitT family protein [Calditrichaeota bacterium]|nr:YitT family protein [Calditrichota bacterium]